MDPDDGVEEEGPLRPWLPPDDRLWRHPSEVASNQSHQVMVARGRRVSRQWSVAIVAGLVGALLASGIGLAAGEFGGGTTILRPVTNQMPPDTVAASIAAEPNWPVIFNDVSPSVVTLIANGPSGETATSGILWLNPGKGSVYILTDEDSLNGATTVAVRSSSGELRKGSIVGTDEQAGVAVVAVTNLKEPAAVTGHVTDLQTGESVGMVAGEGAVGNGAGTVAAGVVSGTDRELQVSDGPTLLGMIAISNSPPPSAGAAVVEPDGAVVGITTTLTPPDGSGAVTTFAIPIDIAAKVGTQILQGKSATQPWLGVVQATDLPPAEAKTLGVPGGAIVDSIGTQSPAAAAGLHPDDVITAFNGVPVTSAATLLLMTESARMGSPVTISYLDNGRPKRTKVKVAPQPGDVIP